MKGELRAHPLLVWVRTPPQLAPGRSPQGPHPSFLPQAISLLILAFKVLMVWPQPLTFFFHTHLSVSLGTCLELTSPRCLPFRETSPALHTSCLRSNCSFSRVPFPGSPTPPSRFPANPPSLLPEHGGCFCLLNIHVYLH